MTKLDTTNMKRHTSKLSTYLFEEGPWNKWFANKPINLNGKFIVDKEVERRLLTWVSTANAWGPQPPQYWTSFDYREIKNDTSK